MPIYTNVFALPATRRYAYSCKDPPSPQRCSGGRDGREGALLTTMATFASVMLQVTRADGGCYNIYSHGRNCEG